MPGKNGGHATEALLLCEKRIEVQAQIFGDGDARADAESMGFDVDIAVDILDVGVAAVEADVIVDRVTKGDPWLDANEVLTDVAADNGAVEIYRKLIVADAHSRD